jgi:hypothetical protein
MKIYDCFTFYQELDLLELRLADLYEKVDHFVIVESNTTFQNTPKPFYFEENKTRYARWLDKIIHIRVDTMPQDPNPWVNERFQRNQIMQGLVGAHPDDIVIVSDVDEIPRAGAVDYMRASDQTIFAMRMPIYNFKFNYMKDVPDRYNIWGMAARRSVFNDIEPDSFRSLRFQFMEATYQFKNDGCEVIEHGGWHFGYLGTDEQLRDKAKSFSHSEVNRPDFLAQIDIAASIEQGTSWDRTSQDKYVVVELDSYFPKYLLANQDKFKDYILGNPVTTALALLPKYPYNS